jgi:hypothetical protein
MIKHKVFISHYHADSKAVNEFVEKFANQENIFTPKIVGDEYDTTIKSDDADYIMRKIREDYLTDSTVTIVLIGDETYKRKYVDWEIASTLRNDPNNKRSGLIGIFLPNKNSKNTIIPERLQDNINSGYASLYIYPTYAHIELEEWIEKAYNQRDDGSKVDNSRKLYKNNRP